MKDGVRTLVCAALVGFVFCTAGGMQESAPAPQQPETPSAQLQTATVEGGAGEASEGDSAPHADAGVKEPDYEAVQNYGTAQAGGALETEAVAAEPEKPKRPPGLLPAEPVAYVLGYHQFDRKNNRFSTSTAKLAEHLGWLRQNGWEVIALEQLVDFLEGRGSIPMKSVVITVDDGYKSVYQRAWPVLRKNKVPWTFFVYTDFIGVGGAACTWKQLREMAEQGVSVQNHSKSHAFLNRRGERNDEEYEAFLRAELLESRQEMERRLRRPVWAHAYPFGAWNRHVRETAVGYGYRALLTVDPQPVTAESKPTSIGRVVITTDNEDSLEKILFERTLGVEVYEPLPASTVRLPLTLVRGRLLEPQAVQNVRLRFLSGQQVPLRLDPVSGEFFGLVPFAQQPGRLRLIVEAQEVASGKVVLNSWVVECVEPPTQEVAVPEQTPASDPVPEPMSEPVP
jgi:peptidoglycan/xylan/chitin deacetylase (PgdA/CDA1 family)